MTGVINKMTSLVGWDSGLEPSASIVLRFRPEVSWNPIDEFRLSWLVLVASVDQIQTGKDFT